MDEILQNVASTARGGSDLGRFPGSQLSLTFSSHSAGARAHATRLLLHVAFGQMAGVVYLHCCSTSFTSVPQTMQLKHP